MQIIMFSRRRINCWVLEVLMYVQLHIHLIEVRHRFNNIDYINGGKMHAINAK